MYLGVDIGSSSSEAVVINADGVICGEGIFNMGTGSKGPQLSAEKALMQAGIKREDIKKCVVTGYGRMMYKSADKQITEISCHAKGSKFLCPTVSTIIDIGGQDAKVIRVSMNGNVENFVMNEKCAAGTGRFLEVIARVLGCRISELASLAAKGKPGVAISSTCTVFAESEVISQLASGKSIEDVALGAHKSIAQRIAGLCNRVGVVEDVVMTGGVALNNSAVTAVENEIDHPIIRLEDPQIIGALGAAIYALEID
ncbi:acyl-CoA dehydratase activase [Clostridium sp. MT-14]|jgi:predicted CoA-substrate-specific enzyme activase|uniref:Acyl-CoA dehydratase activase n=1 Tax=Clostridium aromativorans TaxID=2836848 RepID=A0ABS8N3P9_9CLOT|nr:MULTISPECIES: acyl-CoA dehydratase activase [Clostridium]KAA8674948.1 2-hydroxyglutaryl-CoA dehydratase [Clostridium sp. HV4-5-A1G]MCC9294418.1 acyl-CoA dehydratase activase [Clostridium aromativorans]CAB1255317.1 2-hydroxyisocaproyl-CoA dehydratase activator [Clostridiaceae bacterium BL-3]